MQFKRGDFFSIPNILTYIRILLVPVFILVYLNAATLMDHVLAVAVVGLSALTDIIDGYIARKWNMITDWGKIIDPIADKLMQGAMMFCITIQYRWVLLLILIYALKEIVSLALSGYLFKKGKNIDGARWYGKVCTVILYIVMLTFLIIPKIPPQVYGIMIGVCAAFMVLAFAMYMNDYLNLYAELKKEQAEGTYTEPGQRFYIRKSAEEKEAKEKENQQ